jgi:hypothetical protein
VSSPEQHPVAERVVTLKRAQLFEGLTMRIQWQRRGKECLARTDQLLGRFFRLFFRPATQCCHRRPRGVFAVFVFVPPFGFGDVMILRHAFSLFLFD